MGIFVCGENMKKSICVLAAVSLLFGVASCGNRGNDLSKAKKVSEDETWWNDSITKITADEINGELNEPSYQLLTKCCAADEDSFVVSFMVMSQNIRNNEILRHYSYKGELLGQVNIGAFFGYKEDYYATNAVYKKNDSYYALLRHVDEAQERQVNTIYEIDFKEGKLKNPVTFELPSDVNKQAEINTMVEAGGKTVCQFDYFDKNWQAVSGICVIDGDKHKIVYPDFGNDVKLEYISNLSSSGDAATFIAAVNENGLEKTLFCTLDVNTYDITSVKSDHSIMDANFVEGCGVFDISDRRTVAKIDPSTGGRNTLVDLSDTFISGQYVLGTQIAWASDDKVVLLAEDYDLCGTPATNIILLEKAKTNPNAGKAVLTIASLDEMTNQEYCAVNDFNRNSDKFFIKTDYKYYDMANEGWKSQEGSDEYDHGIITSFEADTATVLMSDIREGKGPDLVIYSNEYGQLNNTDYLVDLTRRIASEKRLNSGEYMGFVTQPNGRDGNHYRLNYGFMFDGCIVKSDLIGEGAAGLTFGQYEQIINESYGGVNILPKDGSLRMKTLFTCSDYMSFDKSGKISLNNDGFRAMADYMASIPDNAKFDNLIDDKIDPVSCYVRNFSSYIYAYSQVYADYSIVGLPSSDGHAETISGRGIGITSCCVLQDAAWSFAMKMMSPEVQSMSDMYDPVLLIAQKENFNSFVSTYNARVKAAGEGKLFPEKAVDAYIGQISDAVVVPDVDSSILVIMNEEMPAYYEGQKSFDEVCFIIGNRVNLMLSERG